MSLQPRLNFAKKILQKNVRNFRLQEKAPYAQTNEQSEPKIATPIGRLYKYCFKSTPIIPNFKGIFIFFGFFCILYNFVAFLRKTNLILSGSRSFSF